MAKPSYWIVEAVLRVLRDLREENTLQWIWNVDKFQNLRSADLVNSSENRVLWIKGAPGVGKSVMAAYIIDVLKTHHPQAIVAYFFCKQNVPGLTTALDIIRVLAYHCVLNTGARSKLESLKRSGFRTDDPVGTADAFHRLVKEPIANAKANVYIVLDGWDEANNKAIDDVQNEPQLKVLWRCLRSLPSCQLVVLSRPTELLDEVPPGGRKLITIDDNADDIRMYIQKKIGNLEVLRSLFSERNMDPVEFIVSQSAGSFLWVFLILEKFEKLINEPQSVIQKEFENLLTGTGGSQLGGGYSFALADLDERWVKPILLFLVVAIRDVDIEELKGAVETAVNDKRPFKHFIAVRCSSILRLQPNLQGVETVRLLHETFASFLVDRHICKPEQYFVDRPEAHCEVAAWCLQVMCSKNAETNAFLTYASSFWVDHLNQAAQQGDQSQRLLKWVYEFFTTDGVDVWLKHGLSKAPNLSPMEISVEEGPLREISNWLAKIKLPVETRDSESPLNVAFLWREQVLRNKTTLGQLVGKAAARVWLTVSLPDFYQTATCFALAFKYCAAESRQNPRALADLQPFDAISDYAGKPIYEAPQRNLGVGYFILRNWTEFIRCFNSVEVNGDPEFNARIYLGAAHTAIGEYDMAIQAFTAASEERPTDSLAWIWLAETYKLKNDNDGAIKIFMIGREKNPKDPWFLKRLGDAYISNSQYDLAIGTFEKAIKWNPNDPWLYFRLGMAFKETGNYGEAIKIFDDAIKSFPAASRRFEKALAEVYKHTGNEGKAEEILGKERIKMPRGDREQKMLANQIGTQGERTVWLFARVGEQSADVNSVHTGPFRGWEYDNWTVLVSPLSKEQLESQMNLPDDIIEIWGEVYELSTCEGIVRFGSRTYYGKEFRSSTKSIYQGTTTLSDEELETLGMECLRRC